MAVGFRRTLTTLASPKSVAPSFLLGCARTRKLSYARARSSSSLPVRLHPLAAALHESARALLAWADAPARTGPAWVADGAGRAGRVLAGLADLLHHPQARDALRRRHGHRWATEERLLDDLLLLADLHGSFRDSLVALRQVLSETHAALRRRDGARLAAALRAQRRAAPTPTPYSPGSPMWLVTDLLRRRRAVSFDDSSCGAEEEEEERKAAMGRVRGLEECVDAAEAGCEEVYRALVNARVSLLNLLTPRF
ncbi:DUF241 domain protein [Zea mays]|uniref:DUF241 domain protein n=2 Tax=Zea mays TaxID=4577 RepID=A0A1D6P921_MAIZE|nr:DUF241 domain protein [Zea mays]